MGINWIESRGKSFGQTADIDVCYSNGKNKRYCFRISKGAMATKFKNAERLLVGANDECTRIYFADSNSKLGYKVIQNGCKYSVSISEKKVAETSPTLNPSAVIGTYNLKYDEIEKLYYISIGALPR
jgi:hypothetical protein